MKKILLILTIALALVVSCKNKKTSMKDEEAVEVSDFVDFFPEVKLPFELTDTTLLRKESDSMLIGNKVFAQFIPDTVLTNVFGKTARPRLYSLGRAREKGKETYLFVKAVQGLKRVVYLITFDDENRYLNSMPIIRSGFDTWTNNYASLDKKFQITTYSEKTAGGEVQHFKRNIYVFNSGANIFTLILTEPNEEAIATIINPIDTLPHKHKFSGDFVKDKKNFISFRDGKNESELLFFVHFEKDKGECTGELKGTAKIISAKVARHQEVGNPCTIEFTFNPSNVVMKEIGGCGSYRDIKCFFEGTFPRKKEPAAKPSKKKK
jgi:hypothetical protein